MSRRVAGNCPWGCGATLFLGSGGHVTCSVIDCPQPDAVSVLLEETEHEHLVRFAEDGWTIQHPLKDRTVNQLFDCPVTRLCEELSGPPPRLGLYRLRQHLDGWTWEFLKPIESEVDDDHHLAEVRFQRQRLEDWPRPNPEPLP